MVLMVRTLESTTQLANRWILKRLITVHIVFRKVMFSVMSFCLFTGRGSQVNNFEQVHVVGGPHVVGGWAYIYWQAGG